MFAGTRLIYLSKAFDCILHGVLVAKMRGYGVSKDACEFMNSFLCNMYQRVNISNHRSSCTSLQKASLKALEWD